MPHSTCAAVTYRASAGGRDLAMQLAIDPEKATLKDAWERLTAAFGTIDPRTIEIEIRPHRIPASRTVRRDGDCLILPGRWKEVQSLDAC